MLLPISGSFCLIQDLAWLSEQDMRLKLREVRACGIDTLIPTLAAEHGQSLVPSRVLPVAKESTFNYRYRRTGQPVPIRPEQDVFGVLLDECERLEIDVFMPTGTLSPVKPGSSLMWPYPATQWFTREAQDLNARFIEELATRYGARESFAGWYVSDEMKWSIDEHVGLVSAIAQACRNVRPDLPILMSPSPAHDSERTAALTDPKQVARLAADIICPMDCGHFLHDRTTWGDNIFSRIEWAQQNTRAACDAAGKRYWANIELFYYDQSGHPTSLRTAPPARVLRQIEVASKYAQRLSSFQYFGIIDARDSKVPLGGDGAVELHDAIKSHNDLVAPSGICSA